MDMKDILKTQIKEQLYNMLCTLYLIKSVSKEACIKAK